MTLIKYYTIYIKYYTKKNTKKLKNTKIFLLSWKVFKETNAAKIVAAGHEVE